MAKKRGKFSLNGVGTKMEQHAALMMSLPPLKRCTWINGQCLISQKETPK